MHWNEIITEKESLPPHLEEALWWAERYVTGSLNDPDWDFGEKTYLNVNQAMEIVGSYVGNKNSIGKPLFRYLNLSKKQAQQLAKTKVLMPNKLGFQSFTEHGAEAIEIGRDIHPDSKLDTVIEANIDPNNVLFGMSDLKNKPASKSLYHRLTDWHHQGEVIVRVTGPIELISVKISA